MRRSLFLLALAGSLLRAQDITLPDGKAKATIVANCTDCHGLEEIVSNPMSRENWRATVNRMMKKGASLDPSQVDAVVDYLSVYFAPDKVNVNTADAKEMQDALGFTAAEANAVIARRAKGRIETLEALQKIAGVDAKKVEAKKDLIFF